MTERHHLWIQPPPTWYEDTPTEIPLQPTLIFSFDTPKQWATTKFENLMPGMLDQTLSGLFLDFSYTIP